MDTTKYLTPAVLALFDELWGDAPNWSGSPMFGGNVASTPASKGHLTNLKKAGLVTTEVDSDDPSLSWVYFTAAGKALAAERGCNESEFLA